MDRSSAASAMLESGVRNSWAAFVRKRCWFASSRRPSERSCRTTSTPPLWSSNAGMCSKFTRRKVSPSRAILVTHSHSLAHRFTAAGRSKSSQGQGSSCKTSGFWTFSELSMPSRSRAMGLANTTCPSRFVASTPSLRLSSIAARVSSFSLSLVSSRLRLIRDDRSSVRAPAMTTAITAPSIIRREKGSDREMSATEMT